MAKSIIHSNPRVLHDSSLHVDIVLPAAVVVVAAIDSLCCCPAGWLVERGRRGIVSSLWLWVHAPIEVGLGARVGGSRHIVWNQLSLIRLAQCLDLCQSLGLLEQGITRCLQVIGIQH